MGHEKVDWLSNSTYEPSVGPKADSRPIDWPSRFGVESWVRVEYDRFSLTFVSSLILLCHVADTTDSEQTCFSNFALIAEPSLRL